MDKKIEELKTLAIACKGWKWPDRNKGKHGEHQFGQRLEGEFHEIGTIDASTYTGEYVDDIRVLKFIRAAQPLAIIELSDHIERLTDELELTRAEVNAMKLDADASQMVGADDARDAARYRLIRTLSARQFADLWESNIAGKGLFDELVDAAAEIGKAVP